MRLSVMAVILGTALPAWGVPEQARITDGPHALRDGGAVRISFAVSAPTDVEVAIVDGDGKVLRHLAAGMLGPNAPAPYVRHVFSPL